MKKVISLLVLIAVTTLSSLSAWAAEITYNGIKYTTSGTNATVAPNDGAYTGDIVIPANFTYGGTKYTVVAVGDNAFANKYDSYGSECTCSITSISLPATVKTIGKYAFTYTPLTSVSLSSGLVEIGAFAFSYTSITSITLPNTVQKIGDYAFAYCEYLETINLPSSVTELGNQAFQACVSLKEIDVPGSIKTLHDGVFQMCLSLKKITLHEGLEKIYGIGQGVRITSLEIPKTVKVFGRISANQLTELILHEGLEEIGELRCEKLKSLQIPSTVRKFASDAFYYTSISSLTIPEGVTEIGQIFGYAQEMVLLPSTVESLSVTTFWAFESGSQHLVYLNAAQVPTVGTYTNYKGETYTTFQGVSNTYLIVPDEALAAYQADSHYATFTRIVGRSDASIYSNRLTLGDVSGLAGSEFEVPMSATTYSNYGFQVDVKLPKVLTFVKDKNGKAVVTLSAANTSNFALSTQFLSADSLRIVCVPKSTSATYMNTSSAVCTIRVKSNVPGKHQIELHEMVINGSDGTISQQVKWLDSGSVTIAEFEEGDANNDATVNVGDLAAVATYLNGGTSTTFVAPAVFFGRDEVTADAYDDIVEAASSVTKPATGAVAKGKFWLSSSETEINTRSVLLTVGESTKAYLFLDTQGLEVSAIQFDVRNYSDLNLSFAPQFSYGTAYTNTADATNANGACLRHFLVATDGATPVPGTNGATMAYAFDIADIQTEGYFSFEISNVLVSTVDGKVYSLLPESYSRFYMEVEAHPRPGDANKDGYINVGDWAAVAYYIAKGNSAADLPSFAKNGADANKDNQINASDCSAIVTMILGGERPMGAAERGAEHEASLLSIEANCEAVAGQDLNLIVKIDNPTDAFSSFQFDLNLPEGMRVVTDREGYLRAALSTERTNERATDYFSSSMIADDCLRLFCFSTQNDLFEDNEGAVAVIPVHLDENMPAGTYDLPISGLSLTATGEPLAIDAAPLILDVTSATAIKTVAQDGHAAERYNLQGQRIGQSQRGGIYIENGRKVLAY